MRKYTVAATSNAGFILAECPIEGMHDTLEKAEREASSLSIERGQNHFVFEVEIRLMSASRVVKSVEVERFAAE